MLPAQDQRVNPWSDYQAPNKRKIVLCRPFSVFSRKTYSTPVAMPLGLAYLAAVLEKAGYDVDIVDAFGEGAEKIRQEGVYSFQGLSTEEVIARIPEDAAVIGVSMMFSQEWIPQRECIKAIKAARPDAIMVAGGEHPTAMPEYILKDCPAIDHIVMGEGEFAFLELCHAVLSGKSMPAILRPGRIKYVDELPRPAWHLINVPAYHSGVFTHGISTERNMPILGSRGCPYQCTFCSNPGMWTTRYTMRDPLDVVDEIACLVRDYGATSLEFFDLTAIVKKPWIMAFCNEVKRRKLDITWQLPSGTRSEALDGETLQACYDTGCKLLTYAPESGSEETLIKIKKKVKLERLTASARMAHRIGHTVKINIIFGFPHERLRNISASIVYAWKMAFHGADDGLIGIFVPYPGSELYAQLVASGRITPNDAYFESLCLMFDLTRTTSYTPHINGRTLAFLRLVAYLGFYPIAYLRHPKRIWRLLRAIRQPRFEAANVFEQRMYDWIRRKRALRGMGHGGSIAAYPAASMD